MMKHMVIFAERFYNVLHWQTGGTNEDKIAYCLSFLSEYEQHIVEEYLNSNPNYVLTADKAERLKDKKDKDKNLDKRTIDAILSAVRQRKTIETTTVKLNKYI